MAVAHAVSPIPASQSRLPRLLFPVLRSVDDALRESVPVDIPLAEELATLGNRSDTRVCAGKPSAAASASTCSRADANL